MKASQRLLILLLLAIFAALVLAGGPLETLRLTSGQAAELLLSLAAAARAYPMVLLAAGILSGFLLTGRVLARRSGEDCGRLEGTFGKSLFTGGLTLMAAKVFSLPEAPSAMTGQIFHLYGALSLVFLFFHLMALCGFISEWARLRARASASEPAADEEVEARPPTRSALGGPAYVAIAGLLLALVWGFLAAGGGPGMHLAEQNPTPEKDPSSMEDDDGGGDDTGAGEEDAGPRGEIIRSLAVSQEFAREASASADGGALPDGLRFFWDGAGGWEPAFVRQDIDGRFWLAGRVVEVEAVQRAYAVEGPGVSPDRGAAQGDVLFFHRDVLHELDRHFAVRQSGALPRVNVRPQGAQAVLLNIYTDHAGESLPESLQVVLR